MDTSVTNAKILQQAPLAIWTPQTTLLYNTVIKQMSDCKFGEKEKQVNPA
jgi:hypothetical protein